MRGATTSRRPSAFSCILFQSTHPMRGATSHDGRGREAGAHFNPRTPCGVRPQRLLFLRSFKDRNFNPRTPCGVRRSDGLRRRFQGHFNPRTPCGVRRVDTIFEHLARIFQSTHPMRGATQPSPHSCHHAFISIHAPHAGCDPLWGMPTGRRSNFNPRTPCGVRPAAVMARSRTFSFQSTHPMRGATRGCAVHEDHP